MVGEQGKLADELPFLKKGGIVLRTIVRMISTVLLLLSILMVPGVRAAMASAAETAAPTVAPIEAMIPMSDGIKLAVSVYTPPGKEPVGGWPAVIMIHGWGGDRSTYNDVAPVFMQNGYVVLIYDCRGFGQSEGKTSLAGPREIQDLHELMQYLVDHFHVSGDKIGSTGISYGGGQSYLLAASNQSPDYTGPKVKAIAPIMGWTDLVSALFPNDVMKTSYDAGLFATGYKADKQNYNTDLPTWLVEGLSGINQAEFKQQLALRSVIGQADRLADVPIYALQAWRDELFPVEQVRSLFNRLQNQNRNLKLYAGGFGHPGAVTSQDERNFVFAQVLNWFDYWLKGKHNGIMRADHRVLIGSEYWPSGETYSFPTDLPNPAIDLPRHMTAYSTWPGTDMQTYHFAPGRLLSEAASSPSQIMVNNPATGVQDDPITGMAAPANVTGSLDTAQQNSGPAALQFRTAALNEDTILLGTVHLSFWLASTNPDAEITARIFDVAPNGERTMVTRGAILSRNLGVSVPGEVKFDLFDTHHLFHQGHCMEVELSPSDSPFFKPDERSVLMQFYHDASHPSFVKLPVYSANTQ